MNTILLSPLVLLRQKYRCNASVGLGNYPDAFCFSIIDGYIVGREDTVALFDGRIILPPVKRIQLAPIALHVSS